MAKKQIELTKIQTDGGTQARHALHQATLDEYREAYEENADRMPPLAVYWDGCSHWLADGFHRYHAAMTAGLGMLPCEVIKGSVDDARWHAAGANASHGLRRSNADKRRAVEIALASPRATESSSRLVAAHCGVTHEFVSRLRRDLATDATPETPERRTGRDGKQYPSTQPTRETPRETDADAEAESESEAEPQWLETEDDGEDDGPTPWPGDDEGEAEGDDPLSRVREADRPVRSFVLKFAGLLGEFRELCEANDYTKEFYRRADQDFERNVKNAKNVITERRPHAICGWCDGQGCGKCFETGLLPARAAAVAPEHQGE